LPTWITTLDTDWATFFSEKFEKSAKKQRHICPEYYDVRAESTNYAHARSHLIGSLYSNDEIEFQVLNNEIKYMQAIRKGPDTWCGRKAFHGVGWGECCKVKKLS